MAVSTRIGLQGHSVAGMSPAEVLRAATLDAARYAGLDSDTGSIAVGKRADLVLLDANPLESIANTRRVRAGGPQWPAA